MSGGYTPVFSSVFTGTLHGKWPDVGLWVCLLAMADKHGHLDVTVDYIASVTGLKAKQVDACIERFMQADPSSRTRTDDGRRLELIDQARPWGWRIVNHGKYREKARLAARSAAEVESGRAAERKRLERSMSADVRRSPPTSPSVRLSDSDSDSDLLKKATDVAEDEEPVDNSGVLVDPALAREDGRRWWERVLAAIRSSDLRKGFPSDVLKAVVMIGGWDALGRKHTNLRGQSEQQFLNAYVEIKTAGTK